jgi:hypothetical protein
MLEGWFTRFPPFAGVDNFMYTTFNTESDFVWGRGTAQHGVGNEVRERTTENQISGGEDSR